MVRPQPAVLDRCALIITTARCARLPHPRAVRPPVVLLHALRADDQPANHRRSAQVRVGDGICARLRWVASSLRCRSFTAACYVVSFGCSILINITRVLYLEGKQLWQQRQWAWRVDGCCLAFSSRPPRLPPVYAFKDEFKRKLKGDVFVEATKQRKCHRRLWNACRRCKATLSPPVSPATTAASPRASGQLSVANPMMAATRARAPSTEKKLPRTGSAADDDTLAPRATLKSTLNRTTFAPSTASGAASDATGIASNRSSVDMEKHHSARRLIRQLSAANNVFGADATGKDKATSTTRPLVRLASNGRIRLRNGDGVVESKLPAVTPAFTPAKPAASAAPVPRHRIARGNNRLAMTVIPAHIPATGTAGAGKLPSAASPAPKSLLRRFRLQERTRADMMSAAREARDKEYFRSLQAYTPRVLSFRAGLADSAARSKAGIKDFFVSQSWIAPVVFVLNLSYASLVTTAFGMFSCMSFRIAGVRYLATDLSTSCDDAAHTIGEAVAVIVIAAFVFGIPLLFRRILTKNAHKLREEQVFSRYGFAYDGYILDPDKRLYATESWNQARKAGVVMISALLTGDAYYQTTAALLLLIVSLVLHAAFQPYEKQRFNRLEALSLWTITTTQLICLFYLRWESVVSPCLGETDAYILDASGLTCGQAKSMKNRSDLAVTLVLAAMNFGVLGFMIFTLVRAAYTSFSQRAKANQLNKLERRVLIVARHVHSTVQDKMTPKRPAGAVIDSLPFSPADLRERSRRSGAVSRVMIPAYAVRKDSQHDLHASPATEPTTSQPSTPAGASARPTIHVPGPFTPVPDSLSPTGIVAITPLRLDGVIPSPAAFGLPVQESRSDPQPVQTAIAVTPKAPMHS